MYNLHLLCVTTYAQTLWEKMVPSIRAVGWQLEERKEKGEIGAVIHEELELLSLYFLEWDRVKTSERAYTTS